MFTGLIVADVKDAGSHGDRPGWVDEDRAPAVALLKVGILGHTKGRKPHCICCWEHKTNKQANKQTSEVTVAVVLSEDL